MVPLNSLLTSVHPGHLLGFSQPWPPLMTHASKSPSFSMKFDLQKDDRNIVILKFRPFNGMTFKMIIHLAQFDSWRRWRADQCGLGDGQQVFNQLLLHKNVHYVANLLAMCVFYEYIIGRIWWNSFARAQRCPQTPWTSWSTWWELQQCRDVCFLALFRKTDFQEIQEKIIGRSFLLVWPFQGTD